MLTLRTAALLTGLLLARSAMAEDPSADELVRRYDAVMSPGNFDALLVMVAHRQDGTARAYKYRVLKAVDDKVRVWFLEPAAAKGQEMLRVGDNLWVYMPNLKRALRLASRESFQGGDFNNGDILRVNYTADYTAVLVPSRDPNLFELKLAARTPEATYDRIELWMTRRERLPARAEYYAASGKLLRSATFDQIKTIRGVRGPTHIVMRNDLANKRFSELTILDRKTGVEVATQVFVLDSLGR